MYRTSVHKKNAERPIISSHWRNKANPAAPLCTFLKGEVAVGENTFEKLSDLAALGVNNCGEMLAVSESPHAWM